MGYIPQTAMPRTPEEQAAIDARVQEAEASAPDTIEEIVRLMPGLAADVVRKDIEVGRLGGVRSEEHDQVIGLARALRAQLQSAEASALHALMALGCDASSALRWLRRKDSRPEPHYQRPDDEMVRIPVLSEQQLAKQFRSRPVRGLFGSDSGPDVSEDT